MAAGRSDRWAPGVFVLTPRPQPKAKEPALPRPAPKREPAPCRPAPPPDPEAVPRPEPLPAAVPRPDPDAVPWRRTSTKGKPGRRPAATAQQVLAAIRRLGPAATNRQLAGELGCKLPAVTRLLSGLVRSGRLRREVKAFGKRRLWIVADDAERNAELVRRHVAEHGVTRCPPAYAEAVTGADDRPGRLPHAETVPYHKAQSRRGNAFTGAKRRRALNAATPGQESET